MIGDHSQVTSIKNGNFWTINFPYKATVSLPSFLNIGCHKCIYPILLLSYSKTNHLIFYLVIASITSRKTIDKESLRTTISYVIAEHVKMTMLIFCPVSFQLLIIKHSGWLLLHTKIYKIRGNILQ